MSHNRRISVIGLGYVGLPVAVAFGNLGPVVAFDISAQRINELKAGHDTTNEVGERELAASELLLTTNPDDLGKADFHIVTVPTPVDAANTPDLSPLVSASTTLGPRLKKGDIVVYESTVYPGATENVCVPVLEKASGLVYGVDFCVGYSPERINPGDKEHRFETITKVVSGQDQATLDIVAAVYGSVVRAGVHKAPTIKTAEAAKVIENTQRDLNIALMNELAQIFDRLNIDTSDVLKAAGTKWNFLKFSPGLVGGHCIGVDPYYLTYRAEQVGHHPQVILAGRKINDGMGAFIARNTIKLMLKNTSATPAKAITILGLTFKENVPDLRNTKVIDIIEELSTYGLGVQVSDPQAEAGEARREYGLDLTPIEKLEPASVVILAVAHDAYVEGGWDLATGLLESGRGVVVDVRGILDRDQTPEGVTLWRL
ncbi:nucleotide sugar dehydrogenase [Varunaivibrio sulfuroxidans]|uniref:UDP-N-acetyl-D-galactosamine dehydrogenase n=1 Tax=Varunaivibrio sulfuroxidans TaxID=1773489 RepID=A0A4R3JGW6_9PROT|nr:nucleotide sugar dehydrogenase [Varunaivibrio sulfuroxidans]TCS64735.1 UDP-N-acetyl-D-galactosamine dehydrogenase [Varunaivibrio sulfuroxidans]WES29960.1 nucleotide sugar dehydrogenase [Varunaivibrio sulfuroxidans]